jgi:hypothetical protein
MSSNNPETNVDDLTKRIADAISPIIRDYVDERVGDGDGGAGGGLTREEVIALINEHAGSGDGGLTEDEVIALIKEHAGGAGDGADSDRLDALIARAERALAKLELTTGLRGTRLSVGPKEFDTDNDTEHTNPLWGVHFETEHDIHLGRATIDSLASGEFTIVCYRYEAGELREVAGEQTIRANGHEQRVPVEMTLDPGEYLLTRPVPGTRDDVDEARKSLPDIAFYPDDEAVSLRRRADYDGWENDSQHGLTWYGGDNPSFNNNKYYYYYYDLDVTVDPPEETTGTQAEDSPKHDGDADPDEYEQPEADITGSEP